MGNNKIKYIYIQVLLFILICFFYIKRINKYKSLFIKNGNNQKRIGIFSYFDTNNVGNQLVKYAMNFLLKSYGFQPTLISLKVGNETNNNFLKKFIKIKEIENYYTDLNEKDYDLLIVNSDQVWAYNFPYILEIGFLSFSKYWNITKFIYAASTGYSDWISDKKIIDSAKILIKQFSGISVREYNSIEIIKKYLGIEPIFVLDPTFLLEPNDYLEIIKDYKIDFDSSKNYLCSYILDESQIIQDYIKNISSNYNYEIKQIDINVKEFVEKFISSINICKLMITDSYHGTVFSIIFKKPFITFINNKRGNIRFFSLNQTLNLGNRFIDKNEFIKIDNDVLTKFPNINTTNFDILKERSILFLKKNLGLER